MDRLKPAQNGLIFTFESTLRIDAHESISAMTPIRKNSARKRRAVVRAVAGEEGESRSPRMALALSPYGAAILNSTRKEIAMGDKEKIALTKLTSKGG